MLFRAAGYSPRWGSNLPAPSFMMIIEENKKAAGYPAALLFVALFSCSLTFLFYSFDLIFFYHIMASFDIEDIGFV